jgi:hypothetical protein
MQLGAVPVRSPSLPMGASANAALWINAGLVSRVRTLYGRVI